MSMISHSNLGASQSLDSLAGGPVEAIRQQYGDALAVLARRALRGGRASGPLARLAARETSKSSAAAAHEADSHAGRPAVERIVKRLCENLAQRDPRRSLTPRETSLATPATLRHSGNPQAPGQA